jgi:SAM-dependent methyltransferase
MAVFNTLPHRVVTPEVMDDPELDEHHHFHALRGLSRLNFVSFTTRLFWSEIAKVGRRCGPRPLRLLDVASGAGDTALRLWHRAQRAGVPLEIVGVDVSTRAVDFARDRAAACKGQVRFEKLDVLADDLPPGFDVVTSSLFLHHLSQQQAERVLRKMAQTARQLVLIQDLRRSSAGLQLARLAARVFSRSPVVHTDAPLSVRAAFTLSEAEELARNAGLTAATVVPRWPFRFLLSWRPPESPR